MKKKHSKIKWMLLGLGFLLLCCCLFVYHYSAQFYPLTFMYHAVSDEVPEGAPEHLYVRPRDFEKQLQMLQDRGYTFLFASEYRHTMEREVILTFDDGYADNYHEMFPILKRYHAKATIFIVSDCIGKPGFLNARQMQQMVQSGLVEFQSHTKSHHKLTQLTDEQLEEEFQTAKTDIEAITGQPVEILSYPNGDQDARVRKAAAKYYDRAFLAWSTRRSERYRTPRIAVSRQMSAEQFDELLH